MNYDIFAKFYDSLMRNADYKKRADYVCGLFKKYDRIPSLMLDVGCGTGEFTVLFAKKGIDMIGADPSSGMLSAAMDKAAQCGVAPLLLCQSAENLDLYGTVDGAVCLMDSLNHITDYNLFCRAIERISLFLEPERLFIFDINTEYKHKKVLSQQTYTYENDTVFCCWQNSRCGENNVIDISLDFFAKKENGLYERLTERFSERAYTDPQIESALKKAGLQTVAVLGDLSDSAPLDTDERIFYITKKLK